MSALTVGELGGCFLFCRGQGAFDRKANCCVRIVNSFDLNGIEVSERIASFPLDPNADACSEKSEGKDKAK